MKIIPLSEGTFTIDKTKLFVPFDDAKDNLQSRPAGSLLVEIQPFVIVTAKDNRTSFTVPWRVQANYG